jgi:hypothetical protein
MRKFLPTITIVLLPVVAAATFLACEGSGGGGSQSAGTTVTTVTTEAPSTTVVADDTVPTTTPGPDASDTPAEGAACDSDTLLTATRAALQTDIEIVSVTVEQCRNGYARVIANPDQSTCGQPNGSCYENEQVFLSDTDGQWAFLDAGTGIACSDTDISAQLLTACEALGLR